MTVAAFEEDFAGFRVVLADDQQISGLRNVFVEMYQHFYEANGITELPEGAFDRWVLGYARARGISRTIYICYEGATCVGFIEGLIKIGGPMSDLGKLGHIAHLYVNPVYRRNGIANKMYQVQRTWFLEKKVSNETLDVVCGNSVASGFWSSIGFKPSFVSMIKPVTNAQNRKTEHQ